METAELTRTEQGLAERASESSKQPAMDDIFKDWAEDSKEESKESMDEGRERIEKDAEKIAAHSERSQERPNAKAEKPGESSDVHAEPVANERYWERKLEKQEEHAHWTQVDSRAGEALRFINEHPQKAQIEQGLRGLTLDRSSAFQADLHTALAEIPNPGEVLRHIALQPQDKEALRNVKNAQELRAAIRTISKHYPVAASKASPRPRAPRPPSEVGGRGGATEDAAVAAARAGNFRAMEAAMRREYASR